MSYWQKQADCQLSLSTSVNNISPIENDGWQLSTTRHSEPLEPSDQFENVNQDSSVYDTVVICNGHQSNQFTLTKHLPITPVRGQVSHLNTDNSASSLNSVLCHNGYITPKDNNRQSFGATFNKGSDNEDSKAEDNSKNLNELKSIYSQQIWCQSLSEEDINTDKTAVRAASLDHLPIVGHLTSEQWIKNNVDKNTGNLKRLTKQQTHYQDNPYEGVFCLTGLGARGLTTAPLMAAHLANVMLVNSKINDKTGVELQLNDRLKRAISPLRFQVRELKRNK